MDNNLKQCRLCHKEQKLLMRSHIIPDFMYSDLYDEHHKLNKFAPAEYVKGKKYVKRPSSGEYESDILCQKCDNEIIGGYESYGRYALYAKENESPDSPYFEHGVTENGIPVTRITNLDYQRFKLFLLSILWRASISKRPFFKDVNLGSYEERIRQMIFNKAAGTAEDFPILMFSWLTDDSISHDFVGEPGINRATQGIRYVFPIAGITYVYHVSPKSMIPELMPFTLYPTNMGSILYIPKGQGKEYFKSYFKIK